MALRTDYQDAMFDGKRKYRLIENDDSTVSLADAAYTQEGDRFGANDINETNTEVNRVANELGEAKEELGNKAPAGHTHTASEVGAAPSKHTHGASDINSGTLPVPRGGTGRVSLADGQMLVGAGANAINTRAITNNTSGASVSGTNIPTCNTLNLHVQYWLNRGSAVHQANTIYAQYMARGIALVTSAPSSLVNGCCAFVYQ